MSELTISTKHYSGPLDLVLFLVRRAEVDINELPIAEIADQYIAELEKMERVDLEFAGEYLVMAAQLLKVKSEMVLEASRNVGKSEASRSLISQLLEFKRYRDIARHLLTVQEAAMRAHPRPAGLVPGHEPDEVFLDDVAGYDLWRNWSRLMREITSDHKHQVMLDERPIEEHIKAILAQLEATGVVDFTKLLAAAPEGVKRAEVVGNFLALLELVKEQRIQVEQGGDEIVIRVRRADQVETISGAAEGASADAD